MSVPVLTQFDGGPLQSLNCSSTVGAQLVTFETGNAKHPNGTEFRALVRNLITGSPDRSGGISAAQIAETSKRGFGVTLDVRNMGADEAWQLGQSDKYAIGFSISYYLVAHTQFNACPGFQGNHQVLLHAGLVYDPLADHRRAGIPQGPQRWPKDLLIRTAGMFGGVGIGRAVVVIGQAPKTKPSKYSVRFTPGSFWVYEADGSREAKRFTKATSAPCEAPEVRGKRRLVKVTAGALDEKYVEPGSSHVSLEKK